MLEKMVTLQTLQERIPKLHENRTDCLHTEPEGSGVLDRMMQKWSLNYDGQLLDCQAFLNLLGIRAIACHDYFIMPTCSQKQIEEPLTSKPTLSLQLPNCHSSLPMHTLSPAHLPPMQATPARSHKAMYFFK